MSELVFSCHSSSFVRSFWHLLLLPSPLPHIIVYPFWAHTKWVDGKRGNENTLEHIMHLNEEIRQMLNALCAVAAVTPRIVWCSPCFCWAAIFFKFALLIFLVFANVAAFFAVWRAENASTASIAILGTKSFGLRTCWHFQLAQSSLDSIEIHPLIHTSIDLPWQRQT